MHLKQLVDESLAGRRFWAVFTPCDEVGYAPLLSDIGALLGDSTYAKHMSGLMSLLALVQTSVRGPKELESNASLCHEAVSGEAIFEFIKGPLRLYWFYGLDRRVIIVATVKVKKGQKTPAAIKRAMLALKREYSIAHGGGHLRIHE